MTKGIKATVKLLDVFTSASGALMRPFVVNESTRRRLDLPRFDKQKEWKSILQRLKAQSIYCSPQGDSVQDGYVFWSMPLGNAPEIVRLMRIVTNPAGNYDKNSVTREALTLGSDRGAIKREVEILEMAIELGENSDALQMAVERTRACLTELDSLEQTAMRTAGFDEGCVQIEQAAKWPGDYQDRLHAVVTGSRELRDRLMGSGISRRRAEELIMERACSAQFNWH